jgi:nitrous-oxide reductase
VDSQVAKWNFCEGKVLDKISVHYNIGHLMTMEGDTTKPKGKYLVALNKLAIDRFVPVGPLHPQNHQLIDISERQDAAALRHAAAAGRAALRVGHRRQQAQAGRALQGRHRQPHRQAASGRVRAGEEKTVKKGNKVEGLRHPDPLAHHARDHRGRSRRRVTIHLTNLERAQDETHGFTVSTYNVHASVEPGKTVTVKFKADKEGVYPYYCTEFCSALHLEMQGYLLVKPKGWKPTKTDAGQGQNYTEADYKATVKKVADTQAIIDSVVAYITSVNYKDFPDVVAMVEDAFDQLGKTKDA